MENWVVVLTFATPVEVTHDDLVNAFEKFLTQQNASGGQVTVGFTGGGM